MSLIGMPAHRRVVFFLAAVSAALAVFGSAVMLSDANESEGDVGEYFTYYDESTDLTMTFHITSENSYDGDVELRSQGDRSALAGDYRNKEVQIPTHVYHEGKPFQVTAIGDYAFYNCSSLKSVNLGITYDGSKYYSYIKEIGDYAFYNCSSLESLAMYEYTYTIGKHSFEGCTSLKSAGGPVLSTLGYSAFKGCTSLETVTTTTGPMEIWGSVFEGCTSLKSFTIPEGTKYVRGYTFSGCAALTSVDIPSTLTFIGDYAFSGCSSLAALDVPDSVHKIGDYAFSGCSLIPEVNIPEGVERIGPGVLQGCSSLTTIHIPSSVTSINSTAFAGCVGLDSITVGEGNQHFLISEGILFNTDRSRLIHYPAGLQGNHYSVVANTVSSYAFEGCRYLERIIFYPGVQSIGEHAFDNASLQILEFYYKPQILCSFETCVELKEVRIPSMDFNLNLYVHDPSAVSVYVEIISDFLDVSQSVSLNGEGVKIHLRTIVPMVGARITSMPTKLQYDIGEDFWSSGMIVALDLADGKTLFVDQGWDVIGGKNLDGSETQVRIDMTVGDVTETMYVPISIEHEHTGLWQTVQEPTCTRDGLRQRTCLGCGETQTEVIPATGHDFTEWEVIRQPTCTSSGYREGTCLVCGSTTREVMPAAGHSYSEWDTVPATCTQDGHRSRECTVCWQFEEETILATGHSYSEWDTVPATCTQDGHRSHTCTVCDHVEEEVLPATGHTIAIIEETEPTCMTDGIRRGVCSVCGYTESETIPMVGHRMPSKWSIDESGHWRECSVCGFTEGGQHTFVNGGCTVCGAKPEGTVQTVVEGDFRMTILKGYDGSLISVDLTDMGNHGEISILIDRYGDSYKTVASCKAGDLFYTFSRMTEISKVDYDNTVHVDVTDGDPMDGEVLSVMADVGFILILEGGAGEVELSSAVLGGLGLAEGSDLNVMIEAADREAMTDRQAEVVGDNTVLNLGMLIGGEPVSAFADRVRVSLPYMSGSGDVTVYRVAADGGLTEMETTYSDGTVSFLTDSFSLYMVRDEAGERPAPVPDTGGDGGSGDGSPEGEGTDMLVVALATVAIVFCVASAVLILRRRI